MKPVRDDKSNLDDWLSDLPTASEPSKKDVSLPQSSPKANQASSADPLDNQNSPSSPPQGTPGPTSDIVPPQSMEDDAPKDEAPKDDLPVSSPTDDLPSTAPPSKPVEKIDSPVSTEEVAEEAEDTKKVDFKPASASDVSTNRSKLNLALLIAGPLFLLGSLATSAFLLLRSPSKQAGIFLLQSNKSNIEINGPEDYAKYAPTNPTTVKAYADETKRVELESGQAYSYENPYFEWSGAEVNEPGAEVNAYMVYFGTKVNESNLKDFSVISEGKRVQTNSFSPNDYSLNLTQGQTYYLLIQAVSNGRAMFGSDRDLKAPSRIYFKYQYE